MKNLFSFCLVFMSYFAIAQDKTFSVAHDPGKYSRERVVDFHHLRLKVNFDVKEGKVNGDVTHIFTPLRKNVDSLFLDAPGIKILKASHRNKPLKFKTNSEGVTFYFEKSLSWNTKDSLQINYEAYPRKGIYFIGWNDPKGLCRKQIWTQGQGIDNRHWIPCHDDVYDKVISELIVTFDKQYKVLSNGTKLSEKDNKDGTKTWHYRMMKPHSPYLIMLGIGEYEIKELKSASGKPLRLWYYPDWANRVNATYKYSKEMFDFFENEIGFPYGWESYSQIPVQDFMYGAMENTTATVFGDFFMVDERGYIDRNYVGVNAHELAHQWFGDLVTARSAPHHWLQESFATYYNMLYEREAFGADYYAWARRGAHNQALDASKRDLLPIVHSQAGSTRYYPKGAMVLHMLKYITGREAYNRAIKHYLERNKYGNVDSGDLMNAFEETLGHSLGWFWDQWLYKGGEPHYEVSFAEKMDDKGNRHSSFNVAQVHTTNDYIDLFRMPIWFKVFYKDGSSDSLQVMIEKQFHEVSLPNPLNKSIDYVLFDPNSEVMKKVTFKKSVAMLMAQAEKASSLLDRFDAIEALESLAIEQKRALFHNIYNKENFHAVKNEIARQLMNDQSEEGIRFIGKLLNDKDAAVRKRTVQITASIPDKLMNDYEKLLSDSSYDCIQFTLEKLCQLYPDKANRYLEKTKGVEGIRAKNVAIKWHELNYYYNKDESSIQQLITYTSPSFEFQTRTSAMTTLRKLNCKMNDELFNHCMDALFNPNSRLSNPAADFLKAYYANVFDKQYMKKKFESESYKDYQQKIIQRTFGLN
jgi:aminopeptidase N